jgi:CheY-specific phosphatase CheX
MLDNELVAVFSTIAETLFEAELHVSSSSADTLAAGALVARIDYRGGFHGALELTVDEPLARRLASMMMKIPRDRCTQLDVYDALGEVVNIAAGNLKGLLPGDCQVSLPYVHEATAAPREHTHELLSAHWFVLFGSRLRVELHGDSVFHSS